MNAEDLFKGPFNVIQGRKFACSSNMKAKADWQADEDRNIFDAISKLADPIPDGCLPVFEDKIVSRKNFRRRRV